MTYYTGTINERGHANFKEFASRALHDRLDTERYAKAAIEEADFYDPEVDNGIEIPGRDTKTGNPDHYTFSDHEIDWIEEPE